VPEEVGIVSARAEKHRQSFKQEDP